MKDSHYGCLFYVINGNPGLTHYTRMGIIWAYPYRYKAEVSYE